MSESDEDDDFASDEEDDDAFAQKLFRNSVSEDVLGQLSDPYAAQQVGRELSDVLEAANRNNPEEQEDPDLRQDPVFQIDLKRQLTDFLRAFAQAHGNVFQQLLGTMQPHEQQHVRDFILR